MPRCHIAMGGNVGDVEAAFKAALARLAKQPNLEVKATSPIFRTRPIGERAGREFLNAAAAIETVLDPFALLDLLQDLERRAGRMPGGRWAPRPLDLDLIFYGTEVIEHPRLSVPHPACWHRRFVLDPLAAIAGSVRHPVKGLTVDQLRSRLLERPLCLALTGSTADVRQHVMQEISIAFPNVKIAEWRPESQPAQEPTILAWLGSATETTSETESTEFLTLPVAPRLDVSSVADAASFLKDVLSAALG